MTQRAIGPSGRPRRQRRGAVLCVDIGNTAVTCGLFRGQRVRRAEIPSESVTSVRALRERLREELGRAASVEGAIICSVVPSLTPTVSAACRSAFGVRPVVCSAATRVGLVNRYRPPSGVGADRLVNAYAAWKCYGLPAIVVDLGTALTVDAVSADAEYLGGAISPGIGLGLDALHRGTALLPRLVPAVPGRALGRDTASAMRSGVVYGVVGAVKELVERVRRDGGFGAEAKVICTGGHCRLVVKALRSLVTVVDPDLTLRGLALIYEHHFRSRQ